MKVVEEVSNEKIHKSPSGGLSAKGRAHLNRTTGSNLKAPLSTGTNPRRVSFAARFGGMAGPMKNAKGEPTRKALALKNGDLAVHKLLGILLVKIKKLREGVT